jgi:hypothetical protein
MITIAEQLLLLGLHDEKGSVLFSASTALPYGLAGATILDLYFQDRIKFEDKNIQVVDHTPTGNDILDEVLDLLGNATKTRDVKYWVNRIHSKVKGLKHRLADRLVEQNVLAREEHRLLWVFNYNRYPTQNFAPEYDIRNSIRNIILYDEQPTEKEAALISLVKACELVNEIFSKEERKLAKKKIKMMTEEDEIGKAVSLIVLEITVAITTAIVASSAAVGASSN